MSIKSLQSQTWFYPGIDDYHDSPGPKTSRWWKILVPICLYCLKLHKIWPVDSHVNH